jgi:hypothetical protein
MRLTVLVPTILLIACLGSTAAQAQPIGQCDKATADSLRAKYPPERVAAMCGVPQSGGTASDKCVTRSTTCKMTSPAPVGKPCFCTGPSGPDPGTIGP